jgi:hypothetical protein
MQRWVERATKRKSHVSEVIEAVKLSRVVKKSEPLPYPMPRVEGTVYSVKDHILFIMEPITIDEFRLITVVCEDCIEVVA